MSENRKSDTEKKIEEWQTNYRIPDIVYGAKYNPDESPYDMSNPYKNFLLLPPPATFLLFDQYYEGESKPDVYALGGVLLSNFSPRYMEFMGSYSQDVNDLPQKPEELWGSVFDTFGNDFSSEVRAWYESTYVHNRDQNDSQHNSIFDDLEAVLEKAATEGLTNLDANMLKNSLIAEFFNNGFGTASRVEIGFASVIPDLLESELGRKPTSDEMMNVIRNSWGTARKLTNVHLTVLTSFFEDCVSDDVSEVEEKRKVLEKILFRNLKLPEEKQDAPNIVGETLLEIMNLPVVWEFRKDMFELKEKNGQSYIDMTQKAKDLLREYSEDLKEVNKANEDDLFGIKLETVRCLARHVRVPSEIHGMDGEPSDNTEMDMAEVHWHMMAEKVIKPVFGVIAKR